jgi:RyR domain
VREPVAMWCDLLDAGSRVEDVRVVACPGGPITQAEILLARALGAPVAWLDPASEAVVTLDDALAFGAGGVLELPADTMTLRAFFRWSAAPEDISFELRESAAKYIHADYRRRQRGRKQPGDAALAPWDHLLPALQRSNLDQAGDIPNKLAVIGKRLDRSGAPLRLDDEQIELLAEIEHGRWNLERLRGGWQLGERAVTRLVTSYLKPWTELDEEAKDFDREAVRNIAPALAEAGWGARERRR